MGITHLFILRNLDSFSLEMCSRVLSVLWTLILGLGAASDPSRPRAGPILPLPSSLDQQILGKTSWGKWTGMRVLGFVPLGTAGPWLGMILLL